METESCEDIELIVPSQANGAQAIVDVLPTMQAFGMTPMSASIQQATNNFTFEPGRRNFMVLISDGEETCGDEPVTIVEHLREIGIDFAIHVIGLDVDAQTSAQLQRLADAADGLYFGARSEVDLNRALEAISETILPTSEPAVVSADATYPACLAVDGNRSTS